MQGAGNDFVVLDETAGPLNLTAAHYRFLANRQFGVGADQILTVRPAPNASVDFEYVIHNADGGEVAQCGNGSRCFVRYVVDKGLTTKQAIKVQTKAGVLEPRLLANGLVTVDMGAPVFDWPRIPFNPDGLQAMQINGYQKWHIPLDSDDLAAIFSEATKGEKSMAIASMGNPHAVLWVDDVEAAPVQSLGPRIQALSAFPEGVNVGFLQMLSPSHIRLRVFERGSGETLACGSGACAAVVVGIRLGLLEADVQVDMRGGSLQVAWAGPDAPVLMTGPAVTVFEGTIAFPADLS
jgi:diaminopimelate epimerase